MFNFKSMFGYDNGPKQQKKDREYFAGSRRKTDFSNMIKGEADKDVDQKAFKSGIFRRRPVKISTQSERIKMEDDKEDFNKDQLADEKSLRNIRSTAIDEAIYNPNSKDLQIKFQGGDKYYTYPNVPNHVAGNFNKASSKGRYFNRSIKPYSENYNKSINV